MSKSSVWCQGLADLAATESPIEMLYIYVCSQGCSKNSVVNNEVNNLLMIFIQNILNEN